jgi:protein O-mannosyl-transferase
LSAAHECYQVDIGANAGHNKDCDKRWKCEELFHAFSILQKRYFWYDTPMKYVSVWVACVVSFGISVLLYGGTLSGSFVFDDEYFTTRPELRQIAYLPHIWLEPLANRETPQLSETYRPMVTLSMMLNFIFFGDSPVSFHWTNILLNGMVSFLLFVLLTLLFDSRLLAAISALLFAVLPIHTEAVAFIKGREEILAGMFVLGSWIWFVRSNQAHRMQWGSRVISALLYGCACFSREFMLLVPVVFFATWGSMQRVSFVQIIRASIPFVLVAGIYIFMWWTALGGKFPVENIHSYAVNPIAYVSGAERFMTATAIGGTYIAKTFAPYNLSATYRYNHFPVVESLADARLWLGIVLFCGLGTICVLAWKRMWHAPLVGIVLFFITYIPFSKFVFVGGEMIAERWMYVPSMGLVIIAGHGLSVVVCRWRIVTLACIVVLCGVYGAITIDRSRVWISEESLYRSMTNDAPQSMHGHIWLARYLITQERFAEARDSVDRARAIYPAHHLVQGAHAAVLANEKKYEEAKKAIQRAIVLKPESSSYFFYAMLLTRTGQYQDSQDVIDAFLKSRGGRSDVKFLSAVNYWKMGNREKAREYFDWNPALSLEEKHHALETY